MKILIIGGSGFIGSEVTKQATSRGDDVSIWDIKPANNLKTIRKDIRDEGIIETDMSRFDLVMVFAAVTSQLEFEDRPVESFDTNIKGVHNVVEACRRSGVRKVMFASSSAVYGEARGRMSEIDLCKPNNMYGTSKIIGEHLLNAYGRKGYFDHVIVRFFNTYGVGESNKHVGKSIISLFLEQIAKDSRVVVYGDGEQRRDFMNVRDAARISYDLAVHQTGTFNVGTGHSVSWNEILEHMRGKGLGFVQEYVPNPIAEYQQFTEADNGKIQALGLRPEIDIKEGIGELISYYGLPNNPTSASEMVNAK
jgi:UDP-glucose 4-epimerase